MTWFLLGMESGRLVVIYIGCLEVDFLADNVLARVPLWSNGFLSWSIKAFFFILN